MPLARAATLTRSSLAAASSARMRARSRDATGRCGRLAPRNPPGSRKSRSVSITSSAVREGSSRRVPSFRADRLRDDRGSALRPSRHLRASGPSRRGQHAGHTPFGAGGIHIVRGAFRRVVLRHRGALRMVVQHHRGLDHRRVLQRVEAASGKTFASVLGVKKSQYSMRITRRPHAGPSSRIARSIPSIRNHWFS